MDETNDNLFKSKYDGREHYTIKLWEYIGATYNCLGVDDYEMSLNNISNVLGLIKFSVEKNLNHFKKELRKHFHFNEDSDSLGVLIEIEESISSDIRMMKKLNEYDNPVYDNKVRLLEKLIREKIRAVCTIAIDVMQKSSMVLPQEQIFNEDNIGELIKIYDNLT